MTYSPGDMICFETSVPITSVLKMQTSGMSILSDWKFAMDHRMSNSIDQNYRNMSIFESMRVVVVVLPS